MGDKNGDTISSDQEEMLTPEESLLLFARNGDVNGVTDLLKKRNRGEIVLDLNCKGRLDNWIRGWGYGV